MTWTYSTNTVLYERILVYKAWGEKCTKEKMLTIPKLENDKHYCYAVTPIVSTFVSTQSVVKHIRLCEVGIVSGK